MLTHFDGMLHYIIRGMLENPQDREDCLAEVQRKLWETRMQYDPERSSPAVWVTVLCRNTAFDHLRRRKRQSGSAEELDPAHPDPTPGPEEQVIQKERIQILQQALAALSPKDRNLVYRKYYYLQSTARMAAELGLTERAVEGRLYRIRQKLQKQLGGDLL